MDARSLFPTIGSEGRLVDRVANQIQKLIVEGTLAPGMKLPPERELAEQLGISRTIMREAVHILVTKGLLETRRGVGTTVRQVTSGQVAEPLRLLLQVQGKSISIDDLHEVRSILEVAIAELAAVQATPEDIAGLHRILETMEQARDDPAGFAALDADFHLALAQATHNPFLVVLLDSTRDLMQEVRLLVASQPGLPERVIPDHRRIVARVEANDTRGARREMRGHLERARRIQEAAIRQGPATAGGDGTGTADPRAPWGTVNDKNGSHR